jgi:hypothetical protein
MVVFPNPLCGHPDTHYLKETGTYECGHCDYRWYTIEGCSNRCYLGT